MENTCLPLVCYVLNLVATLEAKFSFHLQKERKKKKAAITRKTVPSLLLCSANSEENNA